MSAEPKDVAEAETRADAEQRTKEIRERTCDGLLASHGCGAWITLSPEERNWLCSRLEEAERVIRMALESSDPCTCGACVAARRFLEGE